MSHWFNQLPTTEEQQAELLAHAASPNCHESILLLLRHFHVNSLDKTQRTMLHYASRYGHLRAVGLLLRQKHIKVNAIDHNGRSALHEATENGKFDVVKALLEVGRAVADIEDRQGKQPLLLAFEQKHVRICKIFVKYVRNKKSFSSIAGLLLNFAVMENLPNSVETVLQAEHVDFNSYMIHEIESALLVSIEKRQSDIVEMLISDERTNVNFMSGGRSPLHAASENNMLEAVKALLRKSDIDVNAKDHRQRSALCVSFQMGNLDISAVLLSDERTDIHAQERIPTNWIVNSQRKDLIGEYPVNKAMVHVAVREGRHDILAQFLRIERFDPNHVAHEGLLGAAIANTLRVDNIADNITCIALLMKDRRTDLNCTHGKKLRTPLHFAIRIRNIAPEISELFLPRDLFPDAWEDGIIFCTVNNGQLDVNAADEDGFTPLHFAVIGERVEWTRKLLYCKDIDPNLRNHTGRAPIHFAIQQRSSIILRELLACERIDVLQDFGKGERPIHMASKQHGGDCLRLLLGCESLDTNSRNKDGRTALHVAVREANSTCVKLLLDSARTNVNARDKKELTPIHIAARDGHVDLVIMLMGHADVDLSAQNRTGQTAYELVRQNKHKKLLAIIPSSRKDVKRRHSKWSSRLKKR